MNCAICQDRPVVAGAYCTQCLDAECTQISDEDLEAAAAIMDRIESER